MTQELEEKCVKDMSNGKCIIHTDMTIGFTQCDLFPSDGAVKDMSTCHAMHAKLSMMEQYMRIK